jgi:hypothetical protein
LYQTDDDTTEKHHEKKCGQIRPNEAREAGGASATGEDDDDDIGDTTTEEYSEDSDDSDVTESYEDYDEEIRGPKKAHKGQENRKIVIANQLQFICHQLRQETRRLGLRLNTVIFDHSDGLSVAQCADFLRFLPENHKQSIQLLEIRHVRDWRFNAASVQTVFDFCTDNIKSKVKLRCNRIRQEPFS